MEERAKQHLDYLYNQKAEVLDRLCRAGQSGDKPLCHRLSLRLADIQKQIDIWNKELNQERLRND